MGFFSSKTWTHPKISIGDVKPTTSIWALEWSPWMHPGERRQKERHICHCGLHVHVFYFICGTKIIRVFIQVIWTYLLSITSSGIELSLPPLPGRLPRDGVGLSTSSGILASEALVGRPFVAPLSVVMADVSERGEWSSGPINNTWQTYCYQAMGCAT